MEVFENQDFSRLIVPLLCASFGFYLLSGFKMITDYLLEFINAKIYIVKFPQLKEKEYKRVVFETTIKNTNSLYFERVFHFIGFSSIISALLFVFYKSPFLTIIIIGSGNFFFSLFSSRIFSWFRLSHYMFLLVLVIFWLLIDYFFIRHNISETTVFNWFIKHFFVLSFLFPFLRFYLINLKISKKAILDFANDEEMKANYYNLPINPSLIEFSDKTKSKSISICIKTIDLPDLQKK